MPPNQQPSIAEADYRAFISHINQFGLDLGQQVSGREYKTTNWIYSPLSATVALGMTYAGAKGQTASEMKTVLGDSFAAGVFHTAANKLMRELASRQTSASAPNGDALKLELNLADSIFVDRTVMLQAPFLDVLSREYDSGVRQLDFIQQFEAARATINDWVAEQTKDEIQDLLPMGSITEMTRFVLVNALYFYGSWATPFSHNATQDAPFETLAGSSVHVPTMHIETRFSYAKADTYELAELPYLSGMRMTIVLPADGQFEALRAQVSEAWLTSALSQLTPALLNVSLPKFKLTAGSFSLAAGLKALGMQQAFTDGADFSGIATGVPLSISDVVQKAFIAVDEKGTEAAAATGVIGVATSAPIDPPIPFTVDRPFLFFIRDQNGAVLFSGHVVDPSK
jgi:serpin B